MPEINARKYLRAALGAVVPKRVNVLSLWLCADHLAINLLWVLIPCSWVALMCINCDLRALNGFTAFFHFAWGPLMFTCFDIVDLILFVTSLILFNWVWASSFLWYSFTVESDHFLSLDVFETIKSPLYCPLKAKMAAANAFRGLWNAINAG